MALFQLKSEAMTCSLENADGDRKESKRVEQFRVSGEAIYFPAFPGDRYLPFAAVEMVKVRNTALSVTGTCGKQLPMICVRLQYEGEFYKDFLFEKAASVRTVLDSIRAARPDVPMDLCEPFSAE